MEEENKSMVERRQYERYELRVPTMVESLARETGRKRLSLKTANVCAGGAYFSTPNALTEGTNVRLEIILTFNERMMFADAKNARVRILGTVIRSQKNGMAIRFSDDYVIDPLEASKSPLP
jgi:c-di-GMP-binding flagellar brake protein YcgR